MSVVWCCPSKWSFHGSICFEELDSNKCLLSHRNVGDAVLSPLQCYGFSMHRFEESNQHQICCLQNLPLITLPETNMAFENRPYQKQTSRSALFQQLSDLFALSKSWQDDLDEFILMWLLEPALRTCWHSVPASALVRNQVAGAQQ